MRLFRWPWFRLALAQCALTPILFVFAQRRSVTDETLLVAVVFTVWVGVVIMLTGWVVGSFRGNKHDSV
jgi:hypothetical protein